MAISRLHTYKREKNFYEQKLSLVKCNIEKLDIKIAELQNQEIISKKEQDTFSLKYNITAISLAILSRLLESAIPGSMLITFGIQSILDGEIHNLEGIKSHYDRLGEDLSTALTLAQVKTKQNSEKKIKLYFQDKLYMLELIKKGYLKFELKEGKMVAICSSNPLYCAYDDVFWPDYYKGKQINIKTLQKQIKTK